MSGAKEKIDSRSTARVVALVMIVSGILLTSVMLCNWHSDTVFIQKSTFITTSVDGRRIDNILDIIQESNKLNENETINNGLAMNENLNPRNCEIETIYSEKAMRKFEKNIKHYRDFGDSKDAAISKYEIHTSRAFQMNPNCYKNLPKYIEFGSHHKTGDIFSERTKMAVFTYCNIEKTTHNQNYYKRHRHWHIKQWPTKLLKYHYNQTVLLHFIRSPLDTLISAFNYHKHCPRMEHLWINIKIGKRSKYASTKLNKFLTLNDFYKYGKYSVCELHSRLYDKENIKNETKIAQLTKESLYFEFIQYTGFLFYQIFGAYTRIESLSDIGYNFRMEDYSESTQKYNQFLNTLLLDALHLKFNNCKEYSAMMNIMQINDMHSQYNAHESHITRNVKEDDKESQIDTLLNIKYVLNHETNKIVDVCQTIKNMTLELDYQWQYSQYC